MFFIFCTWHICNSCVNVVIKNYQCEFYVEQLRAVDTLMVRCSWYRLIVVCLMVGHMLALHTTALKVRHGVETLQKQFF